MCLTLHYQMMWLQKEKINNSTVLLGVNVQTALIWHRVPQTESVSLSENDSDITARK